MFSHHPDRRIHLGKLRAPLLALSLVAVLAFGACGGNDEGGSGGSDGPVIGNGPGGGDDSGAGGSDNGHGDPWKDTPLTIDHEWIDSGPSSPAKFKSCHGMSTEATLYTREAAVVGVTEIWSHCEFGGFTGSLAVLIERENGKPVGSTVIEDGGTWGVCGKVESHLGCGPYERIIPWTARVNIPFDNALAYARTLKIVHTHAPRNRLQDVINEGISRGKTVAEIVVAVGALTA